MIKLDEKLCNMHAKQSLWEFLSYFSFSSFKYSQICRADSNCIQDSNGAYFIILHFTSIYVSVYAVDTKNLKRGSNYWTYFRKYFEVDSIWFKHKRKLQTSVSFKITSKKVRKTCETAIQYSLIIRNLMYVEIIIQTFEHDSELYKNPSFL